MIKRYQHKITILRLKLLLATKESVLFACAPSNWKTTSEVWKLTDRAMNGTVGQRKIVRFEYEVSHIQCNIGPEKPRSYYIQARPNTWLFIDCGAGAEQLPNMKRIKMAGGWDCLVTIHWWYVATHLTLISFDIFLENINMLILRAIGEAALHPLQRNLVGSWILLLRDCKKECEASVWPFCQTFVSICFNIFTNKLHHFVLI